MKDAQLARTMKQPDDHDYGMILQDPGVRTQQFAERFFAATDFRRHDLMTNVGACIDRASPEVQYQVGPTVHDTLNLAAARGTAILDYRAAIGFIPNPLFRGALVTTVDLLARNVGLDVHEMINGVGEQSIVVSGPTLMDDRFVKTARTLTYIDAVVRAYTPRPQRLEDVSSSHTIVV
jgi:hypothetical protein